MSLEKESWFQFLNLWAQARHEKDQLFDWQECAKQLEIPTQQLREFMTYFAQDLLDLEIRDIEVCLGASCLANGSLAIWQRIEAYNQGKIPQEQVRLRYSLCHGECDRAPCVREFHGVHTGQNFSWMKRFEEDSHE